MTIDIDQSGKVEQTSWDTVLAMAGSITYTILIPARVKRGALQQLRNRGKSRNIACYQLFAAGLFILLRGHLRKIVKHGRQIRIDVEYTGQDGKIKGMFLRHVYDRGFNFPKRAVYFQRIGKKSKAHKAALEVTQGISSPNHVVTEEELFELI